MITYHTTLIEIKSTKFVKMYHDTEANGVRIEVGGGVIFVPVNKVAQIQRGLLTEVQRYYRKHAKK